MKLYILKEVKELFKKARNQNISRNQIEEFFCNQNIYDNLSINNIYINKNIANVSYISENDLERISLIATLKFNSNFNYSEFKYELLSEDIYTYNINSYQTYLEKIIEHGRKPEIVKIRQKDNKIKKELSLELKKALTDLPFEFQDRTLVSIDFEFREKNKSIPFDNCYEFGITKKYNDITEHSHYIIDNDNLKKGKYKEKLEQKFIFGKSISIKVHDIEDIIKSTLENTDYLILHGSSAELKIFRDNKIKFPETLKVLDTQLIIEKHFNQIITGSSLKASLESFELKKSYLHNSGNDAAYTMNLFNTMVEKVKLNLIPTINSNKHKIQIS
jgi:hypothetical protein